MNALQLRRLEFAMRTALEESGPPPPYKERHAWESTMLPGPKRGAYVWIIRCSRCEYTWKVTLGRGGLRHAKSVEVQDRLARVRCAVDRYLPWAC